MLDKKKLDLFNEFVTEITEEVRPITVKILRAGLELTDNYTLRRNFPVRLFDLMEVYSRHPFKPLKELIVAQLKQLDKDLPHDMIVCDNCEDLVAKIYYSDENGLGFENYGDLYHVDIHPNGKEAHFELECNCGAGIHYSHNM